MEVQPIFLSDKKKKEENFFFFLSDQVIRENPASRGTEASAEVSSK